MLHTFGVLVALCAGCGDPQGPDRLRIAVQDPIVDLGVSDGCARFQVRFDAGGVPVVEPIFNTSSCALNEIRLLSDTAATFDAATGTLRVAIVMENLGTVAIVPRVKLRFNADSVLRQDENGNPVSGSSDILGYQPDSASADGRIAFWWFDQHLASVGQPQVLMPGVRSPRRWVEFRGTAWSNKTRLKLFATGQEAGIVPAVPPDSIPAFANDAANLVMYPGARIGFVRDLLTIQFKDGATQQQKESLIATLAGVVVGGTRGSLEGGGFYFIKLPADSTHGTLTAAESVAAAHPSVQRAIRYTVFLFKPSHRYPQIVQDGGKAIGGPTPPGCPEVSCSQTGGSASHGSPWPGGARPVIQR